MEQQNSERNPVCLDSVVTCTRFGMIRGCIRSVGAEEVYVEAKTSLVPIGAEVSVTFQPVQLVSNACVSFKGIVSRQDLRGFSIRLVDVPPACRCALDRLMGNPSSDEGLSGDSALRTAV